MDGWNSYITKLYSGHLKSKHNYIVVIYIYIEQIMVAANNYMFRPLTGHHHVVHPMKRGWGCTIYSVTSVWCRTSELQMPVEAVSTDMKTWKGNCTIARPTSTLTKNHTEVTLYIVQSPTLFTGLQPDDGLLEAETCSC